MLSFRVFLPANNFNISVTSSSFIFSLSNAKKASPESLSSDILLFIQVLSRRRQETGWTGNKEGRRRTKGKSNPYILVKGFYGVRWDISFVVGPHGELDITFTTSIFNSEWGRQQLIKKSKNSSKYASLSCWPEIFGIKKPDANGFLLWSVNLLLS